MSFDTLVVNFGFAIQENAAVPSTSTQPGNSIAFTNPLLNNTIICSTTLTPSTPVTFNAQRLTFAANTTVAQVNLTGGGNFVFLADDTIGLSAMNGQSSVFYLGTGVVPESSVIVAMGAPSAANPVIFSGVSGYTTLYIETGAFVTASAWTGNAVATSLGCTFISW